MGVAAGPIGAQDLVEHHLFTVHGDNSFDFLGVSVSGAGDVDGDGYDDVIVGADQDFGTGIQVGPGFARVYSGRTGLVIHHFEGDAWRDQFGRSVSGAGDVDGDGFDDLVVGAPQILAIGTLTGYVRVLSGRTGAPLWTFSGLKGQKCCFGSGVAGAGDLNEDGFDDVLVSVYGGGASSSLGVVRAYSGEWIASMSQGLVPATPEFLYEAHKENGGGFGDVTVASVGFVDADSVPDFAVGSPFAPMVFVQVHSGADGSLLWSATNASGDLDRFGASLAGVGDIDGDGHAEVAVGAYLDDTKAVDSGAVWVFSGLDGAALMTFFGDGVTTHGLGSSVTGAGDMNADGYPDVAAGAQYFGASNNGSIRVVSGEWIASSAAGRPSATPEILLHAEGENPFDLFGGAIGFAGDVNADGVSDLVVGAKWFNAAGSADSGAAYMISGKALSLASMEHKLSLSAGGAHELALSAPGARAGDLYVVLGSASGTKPGTPIGGLPLPLNFDAYTRVSAAFANVPPFVAFVGTLDAEGEATARFELPPGIDPALAGLTLDHAFVAIDWLPFPVVTFVSNAVPVTLVP